MPVRKVLFFAVCILLASSCDKEYSCENCIPSGNPSPIAPPPDPQPNPDPDPIEENDDSFIGLDEHETGQSWSLESGKNGIKQSDGKSTDAPSMCTDDFVTFSIGGEQENTWFTFMIGRGSYDSFASAEDFFSVGVHNFASQLSDPVACCPCRELTDGVVMLIRDHQGVWWRSDVYKNSQNPGFEIIDHEKDGDHLKITAAFNWTFYNEDGVVRHMHGVFRLRVW